MEQMRARDKSGSYKYTKEEKKRKRQQAGLGKLSKTTQR